MPHHSYTADGQSWPGSPFVKSIRLSSEPPNSDIDLEHAGNTLCTAELPLLPPTGVH